MTSWKPKLDAGQSFIMHTKFSLNALHKIVIFMKFVRLLKHQPLCQLFKTTVEFRLVYQVTSLPGNTTSCPFKSKMSSIAGRYVTPALEKYFDCQCLQCQQQWQQQHDWKKIQTLLNVFKQLYLLPQVYYHHPSTLCHAACTLSFTPTCKVLSFLVEIVAVQQQPWPYCW